MKVAHLVCNFPPYKGGQGNVCLAQVKELVKSGHRVSVYTLLDRKSGVSEVWGPEFLVKRFQPVFRYGNAGFIPGISRGLRDFDVIHLHWPFLGGAEALLLWYLFRKRPPLVVQYHMDLVAPGLRGLLFKLNSFLFIPLVVKLADKILVSSQDYLEHSDLSKYWRRNRDKFVISPFGVDQRRFFPQGKRKELMDKYGLKKEHKIMLSVGVLDKAHYFKGTGLLIRALAGLKDRMPDLMLLLVGDGDLRSDYENLADDLGIKDRVVFCGRVGDEELPDYYNLADVFVFPSSGRSEAFGLVSLEAMACAKPIIVSDLPGVRTLTGNNGLKVKVNDISDLRDKIVSIFVDPERMETMGDDGLRKVRGKYYWPFIVREIEKIYVQAVASSNRRK